MGDKAREGVRKRNSVRETKRKREGCRKGTHKRFAR